MIAKLGALNSEKISFLMFFITFKIFGIPKEKVPPVGYRVNTADLVLSK